MNLLHKDHLLEEMRQRVKSLRSTDNEKARVIRQEIEAWIRRIEAGDFDLNEEETE
ncbi:hypothetical protein [Thermoactinomyces sp. CICC 10521]|uniref:hypothetical protein n=1 Tax=Thermoactinomyces sp. CICC 10521 TaxID=2767426 RepID=UPI0018DBF839|nr:hypothetical protein [Thermoactinomyces sp. CICC 10521]MBH8608919.1 hypothetical protein [Thermoactinomyces sp. CICC 10521]